MTNAVGSPSTFDADGPMDATHGSPLWHLGPVEERAIRHGLWIAGLVTLAIGIGHIRAGEIGFDAHAYWAAWDHHLYSVAPEERDAYLYSPVFAQAIWLLTLLQWPVFCALWLGAIAAIYAWLLAPLSLRWRLPILLICSLDVISGNVWSLFALVIVFGFRFPAAWAFPALTKVTPVLGPVWFAVRREWRSLVISTATTAVLAGVSFAFAPGLWERWFTLLLHPDSFPHGISSMAPAFYPPTPLLLAVELPIALAVTIYAARTNRRWLLPVAMLFANPVFTANAFVILAAIPRLRGSTEPERATLTSPRPELAT
jgi:hypothetical protein